MFEWLFGDPWTVTSPEGMRNMALERFFAHIGAVEERRYQERAATLDARFADFRRRLDAATERRRAA